MRRPLFFHYESVVMAIEENLPTPFGMFLETDAKPARGCWHELLKKNLATFVTFGNFLRHKGREQSLHRHKQGDARRIQKAVYAVAEDAVSRSIQGAGRCVRG